tara:strand:+ start:12181 stop:12609 length:429 start_codon:yes stop_codon:yes gene_type:complete
LFDGAHSATENTRISTARLANSLIHPALLLLSPPPPPPPPPLEREEDDDVSFVAASFGRGFVVCVGCFVRSLENFIGRRILEEQKVTTTTTTTKKNGQKKHLIFTTLPHIYFNTIFIKNISFLPPLTTELSKRTTQEDFIDD